MMRLSMPIQKEKIGRPFHYKFFGEGVVKRDANRDDMFLDLLDDIFIGIRNRIHLFAADSPGIKKIQKQGLIVTLRRIQFLIQILFPRYRSHEISFHRFCVVPGNIFPIVRRETPEKEE
jgi:hypothetical protein